MNKLLVHSVFENIVSKYQQKAAIEYQEKTLTYGQVNRFANHVAYSLISQGVQPQDVMAVYLPSCPEYVVSIIGINKAGGAFMPIDIGTPEERLKYLLGKVEPSILITDKESISTLSSEIVEGSFKSVLLLDHDEFFNISLQNGQVLEAQEDLNENPKVEIDSEGRNYILYTSGSTGNPKVIAGRHKSLSHFIHWEMTEFEMGSSDKVSQLAPNSFDVSLRDIFVPLLSGGTLCIPDQSIKLNSHKLLEWVINSELTLVHCVPSLFRLIMEELKSPESGGMIPQLKYFLLGGDALYGRDVNAWKALEGVSNIQLVNIYGPTETTLAKLFYRVEDREYPATEIIPLGIPISNATVLILNEKNELCDAGEPGRIIIKTPFISNGYYRDQELTKEKFVQNPLHNDFEDTVYDTGDLGKYIANGNIQFLGRADNQVKINGNRVELFEIETVLAKHESFAEVVVGVVENEDEKLIVAYYKGETEIKVSDMEDYLTNFLPIYMHPSQYMHLEEFPLNKNGKVDRAACNKLFSENKRTNVSTSSQVTDVELTEDQTLLKNIFAEVLKLDNVGLNDSFFDLGGTSLKGIRIISRIYKEFGVLFKLPDLFANPSVAEFDQLIKAEKGDDTNEASNTQKKSSPITPLDEKQEFYEVSHAQKRLWLLHQFEDGRMAYNVPRTFLLEGELNVSALKFAMSEIVAHHETLRTSIVAVDGTPMQQIHSEVELDFRELDYSNSLNKEEDINYLLKTEVIAPFSLEDQSLIRIHLIKLDSDLHFFAYCMHHIISDAWSSGVIFKELQTYYKNYVDGETESLPALRIQYKDYAAWQNGELLKEGISSHKEYWHSKFNKEITALDFPTDRARPEVTTYNGENKWIFIEEKVFNKLKTVSDGKSLYASLMATLKLLLYKYTNQTDIILGAAVAGRDYEDLHDQIGFYVNTLAFRTDFEENDTFEQLLDKVNSTILEGYEHQIYPFDKLVDDLELKRETGRNPMFDIMTTFWNDSEQQQIPQLDGLQIQNYNTDYKVSKFDLTFTFVTFETELEVLINYNTDLFDDSTIDRILDHFSKLLETVVDNMDAKLKDLSPVSEEEQQKLMSDFQGSTIAYSKESGIQDLFLKVAKENSSLTGLILENGESFTYGELASR
ncbi:MAG: amino acid adenylation domain-containing protein, partial [Bacteroidota bacterium]